MKALSLIVACANQRVIGINNTLPWHLPEDLKRFKALTTGHHIIMGRKTYESLGRLLPNRTTVIVTRNPQYKVEGALIANSLEAALKLCQHDNEPFLIGGAELYQHGIALATKLYITQVALEVNGDAFFPDIDFSQWQLLEKADHISANGLQYSDLIYSRKF
ncbi:MAG TPA: dihydrofolate reductase [Methylotenera sp.]|nr:dihydrofolate reductase [Methylotenera sp.]HPH04287.1 dihydrofolate reductase [Methylotenera sp.]HPM99841.1 dihydrofolate reductase [Methylotenera sp.]